MWICVFQLRVLARDQGSPQQTGTTSLEVRVERNDYSPVFNEPNAKINIAKTFSPGLQVYQVEAIDEDEAVSFSINP